MIQTLPEVTKFLKNKPHKMFIGNKWCEAEGGKTFEVRDPGTGKIIAEAAAGEAVDVGRAVSAARKAFKKSGWATRAANDRAVILHRLADLIDKHKNIIAQIE